MKRDPLPSISLYCTKGGSDKEYHAKVIEVDGGYSVQTRYGKRGAAKIPKGDLPVLTLDKAMNEFERLVKEKTSPAKGYTRDLNGTTYSEAETAGKFSGNLPHLLVPIPLSKLQELVHDDRFGFEQKIDGERLMVDRHHQDVTSSNKLGFINNIKSEIIDDLRQVEPYDILVDGENMNGQMHIFDVLRINGTCVKQLPMIERHRLLDKIKFGKNLVKVPLFVGTEAKAAFLSFAIGARAADLIEGIVAKQLDAPYSPGRAAPLEATQYKFKFVDDVSCIVIDVHPTKRSVAIGLIDGTGTVCNVGNVGIPINQGMPAVGNIVDIQYRHRFEEGDLCEPVFLKARTDVTRDECVLTQVTRIKSRSHSDKTDLAEV